jgi:hypothetical protein
MPSPTRRTTGDGAPRLQREQQPVCEACHARTGGPTLMPAMEAIMRRRKTRGSGLIVGQDLGVGGRRFRVDEVYFFAFFDGHITSAWGIEAAYRRVKQLGLLVGGR